MNAIILMAGEGSRMKKSGISISKGLIPILGVPNIERTIIFLNYFGITDITLLIHRNNEKEYLYLKNKYNCKIIICDYILNTLYTMNHVKDKISDTFVIEGDVVLRKNIFRKHTKNIYYTKKYYYCEEDSWQPILIDGRIAKFKIGKSSIPCLFGISYWTEKDANKIKNILNNFFTQKNFMNKALFWDDCFQKNLENLTIETYEINTDDAFEMNDINEYKYAQYKCQQYYNCQQFFKDYNDIFSNLNLIFTEDITECIKWQVKLLNFIEHSNIYTVEKISKTKIFNEFDNPFMVKSKTLNKYIAYFDVCEYDDYIALRRIYIDSEFRKQKIGTQIVRYINLYAKLVNKPLRINVYNKETCEFYEKLGAKLYFKTYTL